MHCTAVGSGPKHKTKASEDFLLVVMRALNCCCCKKYTSDLQLLSSLCQAIVEKFVKIAVRPTVSVDEDEEVQLTVSVNENETSSDMAYNYATDLLTFSLIWHGFHDSILKKVTGTTS